MESQGDRGVLLTKESSTFEQWMEFKMIQKEFKELTIEAIPMSGRRVDADYFVPDRDTAFDRDVVFSIGLKYAAKLGEPEKIVCVYASAIAALAPELEDELLCTMNHHNIHHHPIFIPSQAKAKGIVPSEYEKYGEDEALVLFATGLRILFKEMKKIKDVNVYNRFVESNVHALGSKLGMSDGVLSGLKFPLTLEKAQAIEGLFGKYKDLKAKIIRYLISSCKQEGSLSIVASYMCEVLAWSEMDAFVAIKEVLHATNSPVLQQPLIQHEVGAFYEAMKKVDESEHPQFYRYFSSGLEELYLDKDNFPILAQVAQKLIKIRAKESEHVVTNPNLSSP